MNLSFKPIKEFQKLIKNVNQLTQEANLNFTETGMSLFGLDSSHVSYISLTIESGSFIEYKCEKPFSLGIHFPSLAKILSLGKNNDVLSLSFVEKSSSVQIGIKSEDESKTINMSLSLLDLDMEVFEIPELKPCARLFFESDEFNRLCKDCIQLGDDLGIVINDLSSVEYQIKGTMGPVNILYKNDPKKSSSILQLDEDDVPIEMHFAVRFLLTFSAAYDLAPSVELILVKDAPLELRYTLAHFKGTLSYFLAPKFENN